MEQRLLQQKNDKTEQITFHECLEKVEGIGKYQKQIFLLLGFVWIATSFFISMQFYLFKKPQFTDCQQNDYQCIQLTCQQHQKDIIHFIEPQNTLTYQFNLFCEWEWLRVLLKIFPQVLSSFGLILYGNLADKKGRKTAMSITSRMYAVGIIIYSTTKTMFLRVLGYSLACFHCYPALIFTFILFFQQNTEKTRNRGVLILWASLFIGPLALSFLSSSIFTVSTNTHEPYLTITQLLFFFCAIPAFISTILNRRICQSPIFLYPTDKMMAFNIVNHISLVNKQLPILIDLSQSHWKKYKQQIHVGYLALLRHNNWGKKLRAGSLAMFIIFFLMKFSQTSLDVFTQAYQRGLMINATTAAADITLILLITKLKTRSFSKYFLVCAAILIAILLLQILNPTNKQQTKAIEIIYLVLCLLIRYFSEFCYGILLIWAIETFPTAVRAQCFGIVLFGSSLACIMVYSLKFYPIVLAIIGIIGISINMLVQKSLEVDLPNDKKLPDTIKGQKYDETDIFYKFL